MVRITDSAMNDPVLRELIEAPDDSARRERLERLLVDRAQPTIAAVIRRFTRFEDAISPHDAEDIAATASLRLMRKLEAFETRQDDAIRDFDGYVATLAYRTIYDVLRERHPERMRLKNQIRYLLGHDARFALWSTPAGTACGLRVWSGRTDFAGSFTIERGMATRAMLDRDRPGDALAAVFQRAGRPLGLATLVRILVELWDVVEVRHDAADESLSTHLPSPASRYETREFLACLWNEIRLLPANQRAALLLNLRGPDGVNAVALIVFVGVARFDEIAEVLGLGEEELVAVWDDLPLDDLTIAARLGLTRQQVINLRRSARARLSRRTLPRRSDEGRR